MLISTEDVRKRVFSDMAALIALSPSGLVFGHPWSVWHPSALLPGSTPAVKIGLGSLVLLSPIGSQERPDTFHHTPDVSINVKGRDILATLTKYKTHMTLPPFGPCLKVDLFAASNCAKQSHYACSSVAAAASTSGL